MKDGRSVSITRHEAGNGMHSSSFRNLVVSPLSFSSSGGSRPILGSVSSSQPPLYQQNTNAALANITASERSYFLKLAQRFYLSLEMVCEAKEVFDRYRQLELRSGSRASNATSVSTVCGGGGDTGRRPTRVSSGVSRTDENFVEVASLEPLSSATATHAAQGSAAVEKEGVGVEQVPSSASQADTPRSKSFTAVSGRRTSYFTPPLSTARSCSSGSNIFTEETLGVPGLQAFYLDLGIPKSALEVADVIQSMQSFPQELAMLQRKEAAERYHEEQVAAAEAVAAAIGVEGGGTTRQGSGTALSKGKGGKARQPGSSPEKKALGKPDGVRSTSSPPPRVRSPGGEDAVDSLSTSSGRDTVAAPPTTGFPLVRESTESRGGPSEGAAASPADATRKGLPFPLFLFLLQNRLSEEDGTPAHKDDEVLQAFHALDGDHDGILSEEDIQRALVYLLQEEGVLSNDRDLMELASLHPVELRTAITECDMNADGLVTAEDFLMVLRV